MSSQPQLTPPPDAAPPGHGLEQAFSLGGEMGERVRAYDWASTPLGPLEAWPSSLRTSVGICLTTRFPVVLYWGPEYTLLYNDAWKAIPGRKHPWALGKPAREVWSEIWGIIGPMFEEVVRTGRATWCPDMLLPLERHGYREECYFYYSFSPVPLDDGRVGGIFTAVTETTQRVLRERRLRVLRDLGGRVASAPRSADVCARAAAALVEDRHDVPYAVVYLADGPVARRTAVAGLPPDHPLAPAELPLNGRGTPWPLGRGTASLVKAAGPADAPWPEASTRAFVVPIGRAGWLVGGVSSRLAPDDGYREFYEQAASHVAAGLAALRALEEERLRSEKLAELDRAKTLFFSNVSHEFRTPLTLMLGPVRDALSSPDRALRGEALEVVDRNATRLLKLVNSLLDFARIEAGRVQASFEPVDLPALTRDLASTFRSVVENAGLRFEVDCAPAPEPAWVDREMWEKIVLNLLSNAFKFTFEGAVAVRVRTEADGFLLEVSDTGAGIPSEEVPRLFERFRRIPGARARTQEGSGIGLALVQELVRLHGGAVEVRSVERRGSTFRVRLPRGHAHLPADRLPPSRDPAAPAVGARAYVDEALGWRADDAPPPAPAGPAEARILVVDDNADMRQYVAGLLSRRWRVETCADGLQALEKARRSPPDLVLSDVMMPGLGGFELLKELRADARTRTVPLILLSARAGEESRVEGLQAGADDYLLKPFPAQELLARVESTLRMARLRKENQEALRRSEERFKIAAQAANDLIYDWDLDGGRLEWFGDVDGALGYAPGELPRTADAWAERIHPDDRPRVMGAVERHLAEGADDLFSEEYRVRTKGGSWRTWNDRGRAVRDRSGRPVRWYGAVSDVTARRQAEEEIRRLNATLEARVRERTDRLQELVRELETFAYTVAHDLRAPLRSLRGLSEVLVEDHAPALGGEGTDLVGRIAAAAERMDDLTRDLLDYSRLSFMPLDLGPVDLERAVGQALRELDADAAASGADVSVEQPLPRARGNEVLVTQALVNLLSNAMKFVEPGRTPRVRVVAARVGDRIRLQVQDNGIGIEPNHLSKLFGVFERLDPQRFPGTGIGLAIVRKAAERMGGRAGVESRPGHGSTFWVELPALELE